MLSNNALLTVMSALATVGAGATQTPLPTLMADLNGRPVSSNVTSDDASSENATAFRERRGIAFAVQQAAGSTSIMLRE